MYVFSLKHFIPDMMQSTKKYNGVYYNYPTDITETDDSYIVNYKVPVSNKYGTTGKKRNIVKYVPKYLPLTIETYQVLGLLQGEASKGHYRAFTFCNTEAEIVSRVIEFFDKTNLVKAKDWKWYIKINIARPDSDSERIKIETEVMDYWNSKVSLNKKNLYDCGVRYTRKSKRTHLINQGRLIIEKRNSVLTQTIHNLMTYAIETMHEEPTKFIRGYMQGIIAAEGSVNYSLASGHRRVFITAVQQKERNQFMRLLNELNIEYSECAKIYDIIISKKINIEKLRSHNLMALHPQKHKKFTEMINSYSDWWHDTRAET